MIKEARERITKILGIKLPKNPNKKEEPSKEKANKESTTGKESGDKEAREEEKEKDKLKDKPETPKKKNSKYKANKVVRSNTKDPSILVWNKVVKNTLKSIPRSRKRKI